MFCKTRELHINIIKHSRLATIKNLDQKKGLKKLIQYN